MFGYKQDTNLFLHISFTPFCVYPMLKPNKKQNRKHVQTGDDWRAKFFTFDLHTFTETSSNTARGLQVWLPMI